MDAYPIPVSQVTIIGRRHKLMGTVLGAEDADELNYLYLCQAVL